MSDSIELAAQAALRSMLFSQEGQSILRTVAEQAAAKAVDNILIRFGIDAANPLEVQADMRWVRERRVAGRVIGMKVVTALITTAAIAVAGWAIAGWKLWTHQ